MKSNSVRLAAVYSIVFLLLVFAPRAFATDDIHKAKKLMDELDGKSDERRLELYRLMLPKTI